MLLVDDLAAGGTKNLRHTPRGLVTLVMGTTPMHTGYYYLKSWVVALYAVIFVLGFKFSLLISKSFGTRSRILYGRHTAVFKRIIADSLIPLQDLRYIIWVYTCFTLHVFWIFSP